MIEYPFYYSGSVPYAYLVNTAILHVLMVTGLARKKALAHAAIGRFYTREA